MGSGAPRELDQGGAEERVLDPALAAKLGAALDALDKTNSEFKATRDDERFTQSVKTWGRTCKEMDAYLRDLGRLLINTHQLSLDIGSDGGGQSTKPWVEEIGGGKFGRLAFRLGKDAQIEAVAGERVLATIPLPDVDYAWVERMVVEWAVGCAEARR